MNNLCFYFSYLLDNKESMAWESTTSFTKITFIIAKIVVYDSYIVTVMLGESGDFV